MWGDTCGIILGLQARCNVGVLTVCRKNDQQISELPEEKHCVKIMEFKFHISRFGLHLVWLHGIHTHWSITRSMKTFLLVDHKNT